VEGATLSIFGVGYRTTTGLPSEMYRFNENGPMEQKWDLVDTRQAVSLATFGTNLFVAGLRGPINRYGLDGQFLGEFADPSAMAGSSPNAPILETDSTGHVFVAYGGQSSEPRTSFRLDRDGNISGTFSHANLVWPRGIDAAANGDVYILNSGIGERLFRFNSAGGYLNDFPIPQTDNPSDIAINEQRNELYMADEFDNSIHVYDISSGVPIFRDTWSLPGRTVDVFVEQTTGRIFGTFYVIERDDVGLHSKYTGFEISQNGDVINLYVENEVPRQQSVRRIVAVAVPEPASVLLFLLAASAVCLSNGRRR
jgi:hypothetical protein